MCVSEIQMRSSFQRGTCDVEEKRGAALHSLAGVCAELPRLITCLDALATELRGTITLGRLARTGRIDIHSETKCLN